MDTVSKEELETLLNECGTIQALSDKLGWTYITTMRRLDKLGINRPVKITKEVKEFYSKTPEELESILIQYKNRDSISRTFNLSTTVISKAYKKAGVKLPTVKEARDTWCDENSLRSKVSKENLQQMLNQYHSVNKIAEILEVDNSTVASLCDYYGLEKPTLIEAVRAAKNISIPLTDDDIDFFDGMLLGDGHLRAESDITAAFSLGTTKKEYAEGILNILLKRGIAAKIYESCNERGKTYTARTNTTLEFGQMRKRWYKDNIKIVPEDLTNSSVMWLWEYISDGNIYNEGGDANVIKLATNCFTEEEVRRLIKLLARFEIKSTLYWQYSEKTGNTYPLVEIARRHTKKFLEFIGPCPIDFFKYKWIVKEREQKQCIYCDRFFKPVHKNHLICTKCKK